MRHNKKRNTALLYEFLIRHVSKCLVEKRSDELNVALNIIKTFFAKNSVLNEELKFFKVLSETTVNSHDAAKAIIGEVYKNSRVMNIRSIDEAKSKLIKEINHKLKNSNIFEYKVPNYIVYASVQTLLNNCRHKRKFLEDVQRIQLEEKLVEHLTNKEKSKQLAESVIKTNPKYSNAVYKFALKRFSDKYNNKLTESQMKILTKYVVYLMSENKGMIKGAIQTEVENVKCKLREVRDSSVLKDHDLMKKINECYKTIATYDFEQINDKNIVSLLRFMSLAEEVHS